MPPSGPASSPDRLVRDIVQGLYEGTYVAGQRLVEPDLMRRYGVSRSTVREALKRLAAEGVVTVNPYKGAQIRHLSRKEANDLLVVMEMTVGLIARLAAQNIGMPNAADHFRDCYEQLASYEKERDSYDLVRARNRFYRAMTRTAGNAELERLLFGFQVHLVRSILRQPRKERFQDYHGMAKAILEGDREAAERAGRDHIRHIVATLAQAPDDAFAPSDPGSAPSFHPEDASL